MSTSELDNSIQYIKGVGPKRYISLKKLGITTPRELFYYFPRTYQDRSQILKISELQIDTTSMVKGRIVDSKSYNTRGWRIIFELSITDNTDILLVKWFNQPYLRDKFRLNDYILLYGKVSAYKQTLQMVNPEYEIESGGDGFGENVGIMPVYSLTEELRQTQFRKLMKTVVEGLSHLIEETFTDDILCKRALMPITPAIKNIHFPDSFNSLDKARKRLKYEEFFAFETAMALRRLNIKEAKGHKFRIGPNVERHIFKLFPFNLTNSQMKVIKHIHDDMCSERPMNRLLQGDVGSGKTVVAVYALLAAIANGFQTAFMAPTEILAEQHYRTLNVFLADAKVKVLLLTGGLRTKLRKENIE